MHSIIHVFITLRLRQPSARSHAAAVTVRARPAHVRVPSNTTEASACTPVVVGTVFVLLETEPLQAIVRVSNVVASRCRQAALTDGGGS